MTCINEENNGLYRIGLELPERLELRLGDSLQLIPGVYLYHTRPRFADGRVADFAGEVALIRSPLAADRINRIEVLDRMDRMDKS